MIIQVQPYSIHNSFCYYFAKAQLTSTVTCRIHLMDFSSVSIITAIQFILHPKLHCLPADVFLCDLFQCIRPFHPQQAQTVIFRKTKKSLKSSKHVFLIFIKCRMPLHQLILSKPRKCLGIALGHEKLFQKYKCRSAKVHYLTFPQRQEYSKGCFLRKDCTKFSVT